MKERSGLTLILKNLKLITFLLFRFLQAIQSSNLDFPTGKIQNNDAQMVIRLSARFKSISDIENVVINVSGNDSKVKLKDIAEILDVEKEPSMLARVDGKSSVGSEYKKTD